MGIFVCLLLLIWLPLALPLYGWLGIGNTGSTLTILLLYIEFVALLQVWGRRVYGQRRPLRIYGLEISGQNLLELLLGLSIGLLSLGALFGLETALGWITWAAVPVSIPKIILEGLIVALAVGLAEELVFRGWLLNELERDYSSRTALVTCSLLFALLHFIRPLAAILQTWPQFFGLVLLGALLILAKRQGQGRLGLPIGLHGGLVWGIYIINGANLVLYADRVPEWITGINQNPLAGAMGLLFLLGLLLSFRYRLQGQRPSRFL